jgi:tetratricopeptide (TPR) repeat protein
MDGKLGVKGLAPAALCFAALCMAMTTAGCAKLKARDHLNQGVNAFKIGQYAAAADEFRLAIDADPTFGTARLYLATAYEQQFVPGTETDENKKFWKAAMDEFQNVLNSNPVDADKLLATQSVANLYYQVKDMTSAADWNKKVIQLDPKNKEAYYTLGVIPWLNFIPADREARLSMGMKVDEQAPLKNDTKGKTTKADLKAKFWQPLTDGIEYEKKALEIDPQYENAMSYMNLLIRYRADLEDTKDAFDADWKDADVWMNKAMQTTKDKAAKKAEALANGATPTE